MTLPQPLQHMAGSACRHLLYLSECRLRQACCRWPSHCFNLHPIQCARTGNVSVQPGSPAHTGGTCCNSNPRPARCLIAGLVQQTFQSTVCPELYSCDWRKGAAVDLQHTLPSESARPGSGQAQARQNSCKCLTRWGELSYHKASI